MKAATVRHTTCEKDFVLKSIKKGIRLDGRQSFDYRNIEIKFGVDYGCCEVQLGDTKVVAQVSSEIVKPSETRPTEGQLFLNFDLSPLASPAYEAGRMSSHGVEVNRLVERCLKESRPIDVESLCIVAGEKVWNIRVDILLMNDDGNVLDCCCIAAIAALSHFRRPDITVTGNDIAIHTMEEKEPIPLNVHHLPICTTFGFIDNGAHMIVDPEEKEESIISGHLIMAFNIHMEVCCAQMSGGVSLEYEQIMQCAKIASIKAVEINDLIKERLEEDQIRRAPVKIARREGLKDPPMITKTQAIATGRDTSGEKLQDDDEDISAEEIEENNRVVSPNSEEYVNNGTAMAADGEETEPIIQRLGKGLSALGSGGSSSWIMNDDEESDDDLDNCGYTPAPMNKCAYVPTPMNKPVEENNGYTPTPMNKCAYVPTPMNKAVEEKDSDEDKAMDSEEEDIAILDPGELENINKTTVISMDTENICDTTENICDTPENICDTPENICDTPLLSKTKKKKKKKKKKKESVTNGKT